MIDTELQCECGAQFAHKLGTLTAVRGVDWGHLKLIELLF